MRTLSLVMTCSSLVTCASSSMEEIFVTNYYAALAGKWPECESLSGPGSSLQQTEVVRACLQALLKEFDIHRIIDAPCGDFHWMKEVDLSSCHYVGIDFIAHLIATNNERYASENCTFECANLLDANLDFADLIIARDFLVHLSNEDVMKALNTFKKSGSKYLLTTTFSLRSNYDIHSGGWRPINLQKLPFNFPEPLLVIVEKCSEQNGIYADKSLGLWRLEDI